ncbi:C-GCAxxG-C-C family protein [Methanobrevibacter sp.]|uniref:C-GCAxxG-C-C family protein n=1 Tax=Methanobrevibacter sp. TaxID=66852 RepID=UPI0026E0DAE3|nr:C-GCAxxG-C-C family protein [Methanobrevibacter sp.]MDO5859681.1 C-GCAxxG-C-C family protein [Methanobrevibacter sp.]
MTQIKEAIQLFENGYMCSQAVFAAFSEKLGLDKHLALKIGACFGSGMRKGEVCGACTGALMALGLKYGENKAKSDDVCEKFLDKFSAENGSYICNELLNCDITTPEGVKFAIENNLFKEFCPKMVESAAKITKEIIE